MLSSRGQRWAHTELSCCQVNTEVDVKSGRKVKHGEVGRGDVKYARVKNKKQWKESQCGVE